MKKQYKAFNSKLQCKSVQFEIGGTYTIPEDVELKICEIGFHTSDTLRDVIDHYNLKCSRFCEVLASCEIQDEYKNCSRTITVLRELSFFEVTRMLNFNEDGSPLREDQENTNTGFLNKGNNNYGNYNYGNGNVGNNNVGFLNRGNTNVGNNNVGFRNKGNDNIGDDNVGNNNVGNNNKGNDNAGNSNKGNDNVGNNNVGYLNKGNDNAGNNNAGNGNVGYRKQP
jgi:hypothetical protein